MPETQWVPCCSSQPGHRLPTEADARMYDGRLCVLVYSKTGWLGLQSLENLLAELGNVGSELLLAWMTPPEPYVPVEVKRERKGLFIIYLRNGKVHSYVPIDEEAEARKQALRVNGTYCRMVEARDGDVSAEDVQEVIVTLKAAVIRSDITYCIKKLGGKP